jgi:hypothetical protein
MDRPVQLRDFQRETARCTKNEQVTPWPKIGVFLNDRNTAHLNCFGMPVFVEDPV